MWLKLRMFSEASSFFPLSLSKQSSQVESLEWKMEEGSQA